MAATPAHRERTRRERAEFFVAFLALGAVLVGASAPALATRPLAWPAFGIGFAIVAASGWALTNYIRHSE